MKSLRNKRILILRSGEDYEETAEKVRSLGGIPIACPMISFEKPSDMQPLDAALGNLHQFDWLFFTSAAGVHFIIQRTAELGYDVSYFTKIKIAVIGAATQKVLNEQNLSPDFVSSHSTAERFFSEFQSQFAIEKLKILLPQSNIANRTLPELLKKPGAIVTEVVAYCNIPVRSIPDDVIQSLIRREIDYVLFTSSSTARNFLTCLEKYPQAKANIRAASIGPSTSATLRDLGLEPIVEAIDHSINGLLEVIDHYSKIETSKEAKTNEYEKRKTI